MDRTSVAMKVLSGSSAGMISASVTKKRGHIHGPDCSAGHRLVRAGLASLGLLLPRRLGIL